MTKNGEMFEAVVDVLDGDLVVGTYAGLYDTKTVSCSIDGVDCGWPILMAKGEAIRTVVAPKYFPWKVRTVRRFLVSLQLPEFAIPWELLPRAFQRWRDELVRGSRSLETRRLDADKLKASLRAFGVPEAQAYLLRRALEADMRPETTGRMLHRGFLDRLRARVSETWMELVAGGGFGYVLGWQHADTFLPEVGSHPVFASLVAAIPFLVMGLVAWRAGR